MCICRCTHNVNMQMYTVQSYSLYTAYMYTYNNSVFNSYVVYVVMVDGNVCRLDNVVRSIGRFANVLEANR